MVHHQTQKSTVNCWDGLKGPRKNTLKVVVVCWPGLEGIYSPYGTIDAKCRVIMSLSRKVVSVGN